MRNMLVRSKEKSQYMNLRLVGTNKKMMQVVVYLLKGLKVEVTLQSHLIKELEKKIKVTNISILSNFWLLEPRRDLVKLLSKNVQLLQ